MNYFWSCPNCKLPLSPTSDVDQLTISRNDLPAEPHLVSTWQCENRHCFDVAKEGYVNLLLANQKNSKEPGDSKEMIAARIAFLNEGHFRPLLNSLTDLLFHFVPYEQIEDTMKILDIGCGEGYYLANLTSELNKKGGKLQTLGVDISKYAIAKASKRMQVKHNFSHQFAVASCYNLPIISDSVDICLQIFAPSSESEVTNVVKQGGLWIKVEPAAKHLYELKSLLYDVPEEHIVSTKNYDNWEITKQTNLEFNMSLDSIKSRRNLLCMTPFKWKLSHEKHDDLMKDLTSVTANFCITVLKKK